MRLKTRSVGGPYAIHQGAQSVLASPRGLTRPFVERVKWASTSPPAPLGPESSAKHAGPRPTSRLGGRILWRLKARDVEGPYAINRGAQSLLASSRGQTRPPVARRELVSILTTGTAWPGVPRNLIAKAVESLADDVLQSGPILHYSSKSLILSAVPYWIRISASVTASPSASMAMIQCGPS